MDTRFTWTGNGPIKACVRGRFMAAISPATIGFWVDLLEFQPEKNGYSVPVMADQQAGFSANTLKEAMTRAEQELSNRDDKWPS